MCYLTSIIKYMKFSDRLGFTTVRDQIQIDSIDAPLKNSLWTQVYWELDRIYKKWIWEPYTSHIRCNYLKEPIDNKPKYHDDALRYLRNNFMSSLRYEPYNFIEFILPYTEPNFKEKINEILEDEKSWYRVIDNTFTPITAEAEIESIENAVSKSGKYQVVSTHIKKALEHLSDRTSPDYRNSIKESISGVESMCKIITGQDKATLWDTLKTLAKNHSLHPSLQKGYDWLYGYTNDADGIRHGLLDKDKELSSHDAQFMLVVCSAFVNYLEREIEGV